MGNQPSQALRGVRQRHARYHAFKTDHPDRPRKEPVWREPRLPTLHHTELRTNVNVVEALVEPDEATLQVQQATGTTFDAWLRVSTLVKGKPIYLPVRLAEYHRKVLTQQRINGSVRLNRRHDGSWWLTLSYDQKVKPQPLAEDLPIVALDVGITNFITTNTGARYGTFHGQLAQRHQRDRIKRQRKAKLRACLQKKGVTNLPSTSSATGERLGRHVRQSINRAVNQCFADHPDCIVVLEALNVSTMRFKARTMNAYLYASNLGHLPEQIKWVAAKYGLSVVEVNPAYSSQECSVCHHTARANRPNQQTFCCQVCGMHAHADENAARNLVSRYDDRKLAACRSLNAVKSLLSSRHEAWRKRNAVPPDSGYP